MAMRPEPEDTDEETPPRSAATPPASQNPAPAPLTYEDGLRHSHDYLLGKSTTNPYAGRTEYGDLGKASGSAPVRPVPLNVNSNRVGITPEPVLGPETRAGGMISGGLGAGAGGRNVVRETMAGPGSATNSGNFPAGLPRPPSTSPEVGGTRAVIPNRLQKFQDGGVVQPNMQPRMLVEGVSRSPSGTTFQPMMPDTHRPTGPAVTLGTTGNADHNILGEMKAAPQPYRSGGVVPGSTNEPPDSQIARVSPGEVVLNKNQQQKVAVKPNWRQGLNPDEQSAMEHMRLPRARTRVQHATKRSKPAFFGAG